MPTAPDPEELAAAYRRALDVLLDGPARPGDDDLRRAAAGVAPLLPLLAEPEAWAWDLEPAVHFDPDQAFAQPPPAWPDPLGPAPPALRGPLGADLAEAVLGGEAAVAAAGAAYRTRIAARSALRAFITPCPAEHPQARPGAGPLRGAWLAVKDIIETRGLTTTGGSRQRQDHLPEADATCWARLRAAGAACLGKTNTHEFAAGTTSENEWFGAVGNPAAPGRVAGGSSGGSAAAVAASLCAAALGSDTGGSVRIPAACCGVVGIKPTYGRVSRAGVFALAWSLDHVGTLAATVGDAALVLGAMAGADPADPVTLRRPGRGTGLGAPRPGGLRGLRLGVPWSWLEESGAGAEATGGLPTAPAVRAAFGRGLDACRDLGAEICPLELGSADRAAAVNRLIALPESAAYHAADLRSRPGGFGPQVRGRLLAGRLLPADAYIQAQRLRTLICRRFAAALGKAGAHLVATPTLPTPAPALGAPPAHAAALLRFCAAFNLTGWPAISLPCGQDAGGIPIGLQLASAPWRESELLSAAAALESVLGAAATADGPR